jgi:hypothetical protein
MSSVPIDVFTRREGGVIVGSLGEVLKTISFEKAVNKYIMHVMSREELRDYFDDVCIVAGDETLPKIPHELVMRNGKTIHIHLGVYMHGVTSLKYSIEKNEYTDLVFRIESPNDDDYVVAKTFSEKVVDLSNVVLYTKTKKIRGVLENQWSVSKQLELLNMIIDESRKLLRQCRLVLALMDGSILPWHINLEIVPKSKVFAGLPDEIVKKVLKEETRLFLSFNKLFSDVQNSDGLVLVGAVKNSKDRSLHAALNIVTSDEVSDQTRLASIMDEKTVLKSFAREYRFGLFIEKLAKLGIEYGGYNVDVYYVRRDTTMYPLKLEILPSAALPNNVVSAVPHLLAHMVIESGKHTIMTRRTGAGFLKIPTLRPIDIIDQEISMKGKEEIVRIVSSLEEVWEKVRDILVECAYTRGRCSLSKKDVEELTSGEA